MKTRHKTRTIKPKVDVPITPKEVDLEPLRQMSLILDAIYNLAKSRNLESIKSAGMLARRISYNEIQFTLSKLEQEYFEKPVMERP